jgi:transposase-like protein
MANDLHADLTTAAPNSGQIRMKVCDNTQQITIQPQVEVTTLPTTTVYTDESNAYNRIPASGRERQTVCHSQREYARDEDQDGFCEVHCNTMEDFRRSKIENCQSFRRCFTNSQKCGHTSVNW